jgi:hypothetical protein
VYLTQVFHMRSVDAATLLNGLNGTTSLAPIIGAFLSDAYLGRYLALAIASVASLIVSVRTPAPACPRAAPSSIRFAVLFRPWLACFLLARRRAGIGVSGGFSSRGGNSIARLVDEVAAEARFSSRPPPPRTTVDGGGVGGLRRAR